MSELTQKDRLIAIKPPTDDFEVDDLLLTSFNGTESISDLFEYQIEVLSKNHEIKPETLVGKSVTITIQNKIQRQFSGYINSFTYGEVKSDNLRVYRMTMVPWLWFLSKTNNCRIFQEKTTEDIVVELFQEYGFTDFDYKADGGKEKREYCVQYNESDLNFISRLLEEDGIAYYFKQDEDKHVMHIIDAINAYESCEETEIVYSKGNQPSTQISRWEHVYEYRKGKWSLDDYDFKQPTSDQKTNEKPTKHSFAKDSDYKHYEYQPYHNFSGLEDLAQKRIEAEDTPKNMVEASSDCSSFYAGGKFELIQHPVDAELGAYKITTISHHAYDNSYLAGHDSESGYSNELVCISDLIHYRPALSHSKPIMHGPQSATVVGPSGEEIYVDEFGRIKVKFHWDHTSNQSDETSSCYIQVMQPWAGSGWGTSFIPRIGMEVVVNFYDGDVDRPLIMGTVYNNDNKPPFPEKEKSGIRTHSTSGGTTNNYNEFSFTDIKGSENFYMHAEKNMNIDIKNNFKKIVNNNLTVEIKKDSKKTISGTEENTVTGTSTYNFIDNSTLNYANNINSLIGGNLVINVAGETTKSHAGASWDYYAGAKADFFTGAKSSMALSAVNDTFVGIKLSTALSAEKSIVASIKHTVAKVKEFKETPVMDIKATASYSLTTKDCHIDTDMFNLASKVALLKMQKKIFLEAKKITAKCDEFKVIGDLKVTKKIKHKSFESK